ncbi:hypothetical protein GQ457_01G024610 [Hibiscus cannabinus]
MVRRLRKGFTFRAEDPTDMTSDKEVGMVNLAIAVPTKKSRVCRAVKGGFFFAKLAKDACLHGLIPFFDQRTEEWEGRREEYKGGEEI